MLIQKKETHTASTRSNSTKHAALVPLNTPQRGGQQLGAYHDKHSGLYERKVGALSCMSFRSSRTTSSLGDLDVPQSMDLDPENQVGGLAPPPQTIMWRTPPPVYQLSPASSTVEPMPHLRLSTSNPSSDCGPTIQLLGGEEYAMRSSPERNG